MLHRLPMRQELSFVEAARFAAKPREAEVAFPFGTFSLEASSSPTPSPGPSSKKRSRDPDQEEAGPSKKQSKKSHTENTTPKKGKNSKFFPKDEPKNRKYSKTSLSNASFFSENDFAKNLPENMQTKDWIQFAKQLNATTVTAKSWSKYKTAYKKFQKFNTETNSNISWPIDCKKINGFVLWCLRKQNLSSATIKTYVLALSRIQNTKGFGKIPFKNSIAEKLILGAKNSNIGLKKASKKSAAVTFKKLCTIRKSIKKSFPKKTDRLPIWACMCVAFFGSFRMGELLSSKCKSFDKTSTLLWENIEKHKKHWKIHIKNPKSKNENETVFLFKFPIKKLCPLRALKKLEKSQKKSHTFRENLPVFRQNSGQNITKTFVNSILSEIFQNNKYTVSCKSFRCGIPTSLGNCPDIANDQHIKAWGRWNSKSFLRYEHFDLYQKEWIFQKIILSLLGKWKVK